MIGLEYALGLHGCCVHTAVGGVHPVVTNRVGVVLWDGLIACLTIVVIVDVTTMSGTESIVIVFVVGVLAVLVPSSK